jgi:hypothetical protein
MGLVLRELDGVEAENNPGVTGAVFFRVSRGCRALALPIVLTFTSILEELPRRFQSVV